jgi:hypothetical protein
LRITDIFSCYNSQACLKKGMGKKVQSSFFFFWWCGTGFFF